MTKTATFHAKAGDVVWARTSGKYPWWPSRICKEGIIPKSLLSTAKKCAKSKPHVIFYFGMPPTQAYDFAKIDQVKCFEEHYDANAAQTVPKRYENYFADALKAGWKKHEQIKSRTSTSDDASEVSEISEVSDDGEDGNNDEDEVDDDDDDDDGDGKRKGKKTAPNKRKVTERDVRRKVNIINEKDEEEDTQQLQLNNDDDIRDDVRDGCKETSSNRKKVSDQCFSSKNPHSLESLISKSG
jgi:hypothetical protein